MNRSIAYLKIRLEALVLEQCSPPDTLALGSRRGDTSLRHPNQVPHGRQVMARQAAEDGHGSGVARVTGSIGQILLEVGSDAGGSVGLGRGGDVGEVLEVHPGLSREVGVLCFSAPIEHRPSFPPILPRSLHLPYR